MSLKPRRVIFEDVWQDLKETTASVISFKNIPRVVWNDRFSDVYSLCVAFPEPFADRLYLETKRFLENHVENKLAWVTNEGEHKLLENYHVSWEEFSQGIKYLHMLYSYLNNQHIRKQKLSEAELTYGSVSSDQGEQMKEIGELGLDIWRKIMVNNLKDSLVRLILDGILQDRLKETSRETPSVYQRDLVLKGVINSFVTVEEYKKKGNLDLYEDIFERKFLQSTGEYYRQQAQKLLQEVNISQYMEKVIQIIDSEDSRSRKFLYPGSYRKVTSECEQRMVGDHLTYLHAECKSMVENEKSTDLANMYRLLKSIQGALSLLQEEVQNHIKQRGLSAVENVKQDTMATEFVENVLNVHSKYKENINKIFQGDQVFVAAMDRAMSSVINRKLPKLQPRAPELLARYCDSLLRKSQKGITENEIDDKLNSSIIAFKYLDDKDIFQKFYARNLGKRLIHQQYHSMELEESMINRLKTACGYEFTNKFHRMVTDIKLAEDLNSKFTEFLRNNNTDVGINYFVRILQQGAWPISQTGLSPLNIPVDIEKTIQMYEKFYAKQFSGRKLTWLYHLGNGDVKICYLNKQYIINMTTFQMAILLLFENNDSLSYSDVESSTNIQPDVFPKHVKSLLDAKLLNCDTAELEKKSTLSLNMKYTNKRTKFRIAGTLQKDAPQEIVQTHQAVDEDRKLYLQATIVRIMKSRKVYKHQQLITEVLTHSKPRFAPSVQMIKKCIESLIDKSYIERTKNPDEYSYIA